MGYHHCTTDGCKKSKYNCKDHYFTCSGPTVGEEYHWHEDQKVHIGAHCERKLKINGKLEVCGMKYVVFIYQALVSLTDHRLDGTRR